MRTRCSYKPANFGVREATTRVVSRVHSRGCTAADEVRAFGGLRSYFKLRPSKFLNLKIVRLRIPCRKTVSVRIKLNVGVAEVHRRRQLERRVESAERVDSSFAFEHFV